MVSYRLIEQTEEKLVYRYYPNGVEDKGHGVITVDRVAGRIDVTRLAPEDRLFEHSVEDQLITRQTACDLRVEAGFEPYSEEDWPIPTAVRYTTEFADQAVRHIMGEYNVGKIPREGMVELAV